MALKEITAPISSTARAFVSSVLTAVSAIPISIWTGYFGQAQGPTVDAVTAFKSLGNDNWYLVVGVTILVFGGLLLLYWDKVEREWNRRVQYWRTRRSLEFQKKALSTFCRFIEKELGVDVSARSFEVREEKNDQGILEKRLYQIRDLFVENEAFPQETAFTYVRVDDDRFVSSRSIGERAPLFELLPENHIDSYAEREKKMVEAKQRWVLSAPILQVTSSNRVDDKLPPKGCLVFYGSKVPECEQDAIDEARRLARDAAEVFSSSAINAEDVELVQI